VSQEESEHNEVAGMKNGADSTGEVMHITRKRHVAREYSLTVDTIPDRD